MNDREQISVKRNACKLGAMPSAVVQTPSQLRRVTIKGSAISMMIELLVAGLTGGQFSFEVDWSAHPGAQTPRTGQVFIGIDPVFSGGVGFAGKAREFVTRLSDAGLTAYPGYRRWKNRGTQDICISAENYRRLNGYAQGDI